MKGGHTPRKKNKKRKNGFGRWDQTLPFKRKENRGLIQWIKPQSRFLFLKKRIQKCKNEKGNIRTLRGPPFHFYNFDRPSGGESSE